MTDGRDAMVAIGMNGEPLPRAHGFPARLVVPGLYGFVGATKWLTRLTLTTYAEQRGLLDQARLGDRRADQALQPDRHPAAALDIKAGRHAIGGVAWAQHRRGRARSRCASTAAPWQQATLGPDAGVDYWRQWYLPWDASPGSHQLAVRATDRDGDVQTAVRATPFPDGSSGDPGDRRQCRLNRPIRTATEPAPNHP